MILTFLWSISWELSFWREIYRWSRSRIIITLDKRGTVSRKNSAHPIFFRSPLMYGRTWFWQIHPDNYSSPRLIPQFLEIFAQDWKNKSFCRYMPQLSKIVGGTMGHSNLCLRLIQILHTGLSYRKVIEYSKSSINRNTWRVCHPYEKSTHKQC